MKNRYIAIASLLLLSSFVAAQQNEAERIIADMLEEMATDEKLSEDGMEAASMTVSSWEQPINLNTATREDLERLIFLTPTQIESILHRRKMIGSFVTQQELLTLPDFSEIDIERLFVFAFIGEAQPKPQKTLQWKQDAVARVQRTFPLQKGYKAKDDTTAAAFLGDPQRLLLRISGSVGSKWNYGLVGEKDAGDPMFSHGTTLTDFVSGFLVYRPQKTIVKQVILGHYAAQYGQGLGMWAGFSSDNSAMQNSIHRRARGLISTMSSSEFGYLRGAAISTQYQNVAADFYLSVMDGDATPAGVNEKGETFFSSIRSDGLHRTESEYRTRKNLTQHTLGTYWTYKMENARASVGYHQWHGSMPWGRDGQLFRAFLPEGKNIGTLHADYRFTNRFIVLYGEAVWQTMNAFAAMQGIDISLGNGNSATLAYRKFGKKYYPINQNPFSMTGTPGGESGFYAALTVAPLPHLTLQGNVNIYQNAWLKFQKPFLTDGYKCRITAIYNLPARNELRLKIRHDNREDGEAEDATQLTDKRRTAVRLQWSAPVGKWLNLKTSLEGVRAAQKDAPNSDGFIVVQEAKLNFERVNLSLMFAHFDTDDYESRVYTYISDVLYSMSTPAFSDRGITALANLKVELAKGVNLWIWGNYTKYYNKDVISSGNTQIDASHRFDAKVQLQVKLNKLWRLGEE